MLYCIHFSIKYIIPSKHFNVGSTLFLGWYDVTTSHSLKSTSKQRRVCQRWNFQRRTTLCFSTLNWTTLDNVETMLSFSTPIFTTLGNVEATLRIWPFGKKIKPRFKNKIIFLSLKNLLDSKWLDWTPDEIIRENLWEFQYAFKYVHQTLIIVNED